MKILQINNFHYLLGGADKVYLETSELLKNNGHTVQFFSTKNPRNNPTEFEKYFVNDINYYSLGSISSKIKAAIRFIYSNKSAKNLERLLKEHTPDIAHVHVFQGRLSCSILPILKKHKIPIVFSLHEYKVLCPVYTFLNNKSEVCEACKGKHFYNCLLKKCNQNSTLYSLLSTVESYLRNNLFPIEKYGSHFIMVSDFILAKHHEYRPAMMSKSSRLYNFNSYEHQVTKKKKENYFLYFGRLAPEKGIITLLEVFRQKSELKLKIVGTGLLENEIKSFIHTHALDNVEVLGYKKGEELNDLIQKANFTIVPSEWYESFGLIIIESMALGTPVIASNIGAIPELVQEDKTGFLFKPKDCQALLQKIKKAVMLSEQDYKTMSENCQRFAHHNFKKETHYKQLIAIYKNSIESYHEQA